MGPTHLTEVSSEVSKLSSRWQRVCVFYLLHTAYIHKLADVSHSGTAVSYSLGSHALGGAKSFPVITTVKNRQPGLCSEDDYGE